MKPVQGCIKFPIPPPWGGGNRIKLLGKKIKWGRRKEEGKKGRGGKKRRGRKKGRGRRREREGKGGRKKWNKL